MERCARRTLGERRDVEGEVLALPRGPLVLPVTVNASRLAEALGTSLSDDAGDYVCNGWLYRVLRARPRARIGFVHLPPEGMEADLLRGALACLLEGS